MTELLMIGMPLTAFCERCVVQSHFEIRKGLPLRNCFFFQLQYLIINAVVFVCPLKESKRKHCLLLQSQLHIVQKSELL